MSRKPIISMASMNTPTLADFNRMTVLMSISEITPQLYISGQMAATIEQVQKLGITYILNVAVESHIIPYPKNIKFEKCDILDFPTAPISNYFNSLTDKIHAHITANKYNKVLVHCMAGISRSVTIVCAYLLRYMNMSLRDAYLLCKRRRPISFPNLGFWNQLIAYEYQLKKENSVKMIPTQFGHIPDVAFEEIQQIRGQQQPTAAPSLQPSSLPFSPPTFFSNISNPSINSPSSNDSLFVSSSQARPTPRESQTNNLNNTPRSRSLASNNANRTSIVAPPMSTNSPVYQSATMITNKQTYLTPTRFGISRLNPPPVSNNSLSSGPNTMSSSNEINRSIIKSTAANNKYRSNSQQPPSVTTTLSNASTVNSGQRNSHYETTYRSSFIKPLIP